MKKLALVTALAASLSLVSLSLHAGELDNATVLSHKQIITGGASGNVIIKPYTGFGKKKPSGKYSNCTAIIGSAMAYVNENFTLQGNFYWNIENNTDREQDFSIDMKVSTDNNQQIDNVWYISVGAHETSSNEAIENLVGIFTTVGTRQTHADLVINGPDGCQDHDTSFVDVEKLGK